LFLPKQSAQGAAIREIAPAERTILAYPKLKKPASNVGITPISLTPLYFTTASTKKIGNYDEKCHSGFLRVI
jgi:hypothetical protein